MEKDKLRVGVVGLGAGKWHGKEYNKSPRCELVALADINKELLEKVGEELGIEQRYTDAQEMFAKAQLDVVSIAIPNKLHCSMTLSALDHGLHVLCEKPMAMNVAEAEQMKAAAQKAGKSLMINLSYRFEGISQALKQQVDAGVIGHIYYGRTVWHRRRGMPTRNWFCDIEQAGGGPLIDLGVHRIDLALWLMGNPQPISVNAATYDLLGTAAAKQKNIPYTTEDLACGMIRFKNGATLLLEASWALNINEEERMITELYGDKGGLVQKNVNGTYEMTGEFHTNKDGFFYTTRLDCVDKDVPSAEAAFIDSILDGKDPPVTADDGIAVQTILDAMYKSAATGKEVLL